MTLTDATAIKLLEKVRSVSLEESVYYYPDNERDGRSDLEFLADEVSYAVSCFNEDGHCWNDDLEDAKRKLRETKYGRIRLLDPRTMKPIYGYWDSDIASCKEIVNEYARLKRLGERLQRMGYYGRWWRF